MSCCEFSSGPRFFVPCTVVRGFELYSGLCFLYHVMVQGFDPFSGPCFFCYVFAQNGWCRNQNMANLPKEMHNLKKMFKSSTCPPFCKRPHVLISCSALIMDLVRYWSPDVYSADVLMSFPTHLLTRSPEVVWSAEYCLLFPGATLLSHCADLLMYTELLNRCTRLYPVGMQWLSDLSVTRKFTIIDLNR